MHASGPADLALEAELLADRGAVAQAVRLLMGANLEAEAAALVDDRVLRLLARHDHGEVLAAVEALPSRSRSITAKLAHADARLLSGRADTTELHQLIEQARRQAHDDVASFGTAILVEHLMLHGDPMSILMALQELGALSSDLLPPPLILIARARLHRACALARLFLGPDAFSEADADRGSAVADFNRAGWQVDRWMTIAAFHFIRSAVSWSASAVDRFATIEARDQLIAAGSEQAPWGRYAVAVTAFCHGDITAVQTEIDLIARADQDRLSFLNLLAEHLGAVITLVLMPPGQSTDPVATRLSEIVDQVRREYPLLIGTMLIQTTQALIEAGRTGDALAWFGRVATIAPMLAHEPHEREVMACRIALLLRVDPLPLIQAGGPLRMDDSVPATESVAAIGSRMAAALAALLALGHRPMARGTALRCAATARRAGADDLADEMLAWAREHSAGAGEPTWWDVRAERMARRAAPAIGSGRTVIPLPDQVPSSLPDLSNGPGCQLRLLTPSAVLVVDGELRRLAPALLRLIAVLAALERPVATEQLIDLLWPDADPIACRGRLKSAHHRLRQALAPADELIRRDGDVWSVASSGTWRVDLWEFHRLAAGDRAQRLAALRMPEGLIWQVQFPYDEALAERRSWLEARWLNLAQELANTGEVSGAEVRQRAERLGLDGAGRLSAAG